jgi:hypothetical protein
MADLPEVTVEAVTEILASTGLPISEQPNEMSWDRTPGVHTGPCMAGGPRRVGVYAEPGDNEQLLHEASAVLLEAGYKTEWVAGIYWWVAVWAEGEF